VSSPFVSWSPELNEVYQANSTAATAALQDQFGPLAAFAYQSPPTSPFTRVLTETSWDALVYAAQQELGRLAESTTFSPFINELEPELQYPALTDVATEEPIRDENSDVPNLVLPSPIIYAQVARVPSPAPVRYSTPVFVKEESPVVPDPVAPPALATDQLVVKEEPPESPVLTFSPTPVQPASPTVANPSHLHLFDLPPCSADTLSHPHQFSLVYQGANCLWYPQEEFVNRDFLSLIPVIGDLEHVTQSFVTPFRGPTPHIVTLESRTGALFPVHLCAKVGRHPYSLHFPLGYLEVSFRDAIKFIFRSFPPDWLEHFEGAYVTLLIFDFLDGRRATIRGKLHFTSDGLYCTDRVLYTEDLLRADPSLFRFVCNPRTPTNPLAHVGYADETNPL
jgi:hypothetical protein